MTDVDLTVALDMDSTVYDLLTPWLEWVEKEHGECLTIDDLETWHWDKQVKCGGEVYYFLHREGMFFGLKPFPGAIDAINEVHDMGVRQFFISTIVSKTGAWEKQKAIERDFPHLAKDVLITSGNKDIVRADVLVDDGPHNLTAFRKYGLTVKLPYRYNQSVVTDFVMFNWSEYPGIIKQIIAAREEHTQVPGGMRDVHRVRVTVED